MSDSFSPELRGQLDRAVQALRESQKICVLTGAGVSAESGVPTFRASDGLWEGHRIEDVATPGGYRRNPQLVWNFYNQRRANVATVLPNPAHGALAELEQRFAPHFTLATQNVDGLHQLAGSKNVLELHGSLYRTRCLGCGTIVDRGLTPLAALPECEDCSSQLRPDIVWFEEMLPPRIWKAAANAAAKCDLLLVVGTSALVHPAAGLIDLAREGERFLDTGTGAWVVKVNLAATAATAKADVALHGAAGMILPELLRLWRG